MHEEALINFMREVSTKLGSVEASLVEINRRLNEGNDRMQKNDSLNDTLAREILVLRNEDTEIKKILAEESQKRRELEKKMEPVLTAWGTVGSNRKFLLFVSSSMLALMAIAAAFFNFLEMLRGGK